MLYLIYLSWGTVGQGRVSFLEMARYLRRSKTQTRNDMFALANEGLVDCVEVFSVNNAKKYFVSLTDKGQDYLMSNFDAAVLQYHQHVAETIAAIKAKQATGGHGEYEIRKLSKKERQAIAAGQKDMFSHG